MPAGWSALTVVIDVKLNVIILDVPLITDVVGNGRDALTALLVFVTTKLHVKPLVNVT